MLTVLRAGANLCPRATTCRRGFHGTISLAVNHTQPHDKLESVDPPTYEGVFLPKLSRLNLESPLLKSHRWRQETKKKIKGPDGSSRFTFALRPDVPQVSLDQKPALLKEMRRETAEEYADAYSSKSVFFRYAIPRLLMRNVFQRKSGDNAILILITPPFLHWTMNNDFMVRLLEACCPKARDSVTAVTAAVDKIWVDDPSGNEADGLSIMTGRVNELFDFRLGSDDKPNSGKLRFTIDASNKHQHPVAIDLPLANTLFHTGKERFLNYSTWDRHRNRCFKSKTRGPVSGVSISITPAEARKQPEHATSLGIDIKPRLVSLTKPRKIKSCLGNIISEIEIETGKGVPASSELEDAVDILRKSRAEADTMSDQSPADQETTGIWALVGHIPEDSNPSFDFEGAMKKLNGQFGDYSTERETADFNCDILGDLVERGFQLHRVVSGGGGWEGKTGRLALDITSSDDVDEDGEESSLRRFLNGMDTNGPPILQQGSVTPGAYIQFLTVPRPGPSTSPFKAACQSSSTAQAQKRAPTLISRDLEAEEDAHVFPCGMMFGKATNLFAASEPDELAKPGDPRAFDWDPVEHGIMATIGQFGALSVQGVSVRSVVPPESAPSRPGDMKIQTRLDIPHSHVGVPCVNVKMGMDIQLEKEDGYELEQGKAGI